MCGKKKTETEVLTSEKETDEEDEKAWKHSKQIQIKERIYILNKYIIKIEGRQK